ncbi:hypothetical protein TURU_161293 [Turdus rufiventris]|nr:hypothetical protein TURU_161293 [Turdus rufiventris]
MTCYLLLPENRESVWKRLDRILEPKRGLQLTRNRKRELHDLVHVRKVTDAQRAKGRLNKGVEEKKAMAIAERTQEGRNGTSAPEAALAMQERGNHLLWPAMNTDEKREKRREEKRREEKRREEKRREETRRDETRRDETRRDEKRREEKRREEKRREEKRREEKTSLQPFGT